MTWPFARPFAHNLRKGGRLGTEMRTSEARPIQVGRFSVSRMLLSRSANAADQVIDEPRFGPDADPASRVCDDDDFHDLVAGAIGGAAVAAAASQPFRPAERVVVTPGGLARAG